MAFTATDKTFVSGIFSLSEKILLKINLSYSLYHSPTPSALWASMPDDWSWMPDMFSIVFHSSL